MQQEHQTQLLIGSALCISFRTLLYPSGMKTQTDRVQDQERQYTRACIEAYKRQLIMGRHFFHEHPVHASSWHTPEMRELMNDGRVHLVQGPMCHWRLSSTGEGDAQGFVRGKTRWATSSSRLAALLAREHAGENRRVRLIGWNEMIAASMYSPKFVNEALGVLGKQLIDDERLDSVSLYSAGPTADFPELDTREWQERRNRVGVEAEASLTTFLKVNVRNDKVDLTRCKMGPEKQRRKGQSSIGRERDQEGQV